MGIPVVAWHGIKYVSLVVSLTFALFYLLCVTTTTKKIFCFRVFSVCIFTKGVPLSYHCHQHKGTRIRRQYNKQCGRYDTLHNPLIPLCTHEPCRLSEAPPALRLRSDSIRSIYIFTQDALHILVIAVPTPNTDTHTESTFRPKYHNPAKESPQHSPQPPQTWLKQPPPTTTPTSTTPKSATKRRRPRTRSTTGRTPGVPAALALPSPLTRAATSCPEKQHSTNCVSGSTNLSGKKDGTLHGRGWWNRRMD